MKHLLPLARPAAWLLLLAVLLASRATRAQVTLTPPRNGYVARTGPVSAELGSVLKKSSRAALRVFGTQAGGRKAGTATVVGGRIAWVPAVGFAAGETVWATLDRAAVVDTNQVLPLSRSQVWQLTARAAPSSGQLTPQATVEWQEIPEVLTAGDLDGDGDLDLLGIYTTNGNNVSTLSVRLNDGTGTYYPAADQKLAFPVTALTLGDVDNDGDLDAVVLGSNPATYATGYYVVLGNQGGRLVAGPTQPLGGAPTSGAALADLDGDGDLDLTYSVMLANSSALHVRLNAQGSFGAATVVGGSLSQAAVGDLNNDGALDVLCLNTSTNRLATLLNGGSGALTAGPTSPLDANGQSLRLADLDNDGDLDALTTHLPATGMTVRVWHNNGAGAFSGGATVAVPGLVLGLALADVDGDGDPDVVYAHSDAHLTTALNDGTGALTLTSTTLPPDVDGLGRLMALDFDGDGDLDVAAVAIPSADSRYGLLLLRNGAAAAAPFAITAASPPANRPAPRPASLTVTASTSLGGATGLVATSSLSRGRVSGSLSAAGNIATLAPATSRLPGEVVTASATKRLLSAAGAPLPRPYVWQFVAAVAGGTAQFSAGQIIRPGTGANSLCLRLVDIDGDQDLDVVTSSALPTLTFDPQEPLLSVQRNLGGGTFAAPAWLLAPGIYGNRFDFADVDADGDLDFVGRTYTADPSAGTTTPQGWVWRNDGQGAFTAQGAVDNPAVGAYESKYGCALADLNGDGAPDLLNGSVRFNDGQGSFYGGGSPLGAYYLRGVVAVDLDNDGDLDALTSVDGGYEYYVHLNDGMGYLASGKALRANSFGEDLLVRDLDADGDADLVAYGFSTAEVWLNDGRAGFSRQAALAGYQSPPGFPLALGDVNGDGAPDLLTSSGCYLNNGQARFQPASSQPTALFSTTARGTLGDLDGDGDLDYVSAQGTLTQVYVNAGRPLVVAAPAAAPAPAWPNPVASGGLLHLNSALAGPATLTLRTVLGQLLWTQAVPGADTAAPMGPLPAGVYVLTVQQPGSPPRTQRLTVE